MELVKRIERLIGSSLENMGYVIVRVQFSGDVRCVLQVMIERTDRKALSVDDCATASREISVVLDVEDVAAEQYTLEVSSPGIDRPLVRLDDFERFSGFEAKVEMIEAREGRRRFRGRLLGAGGGVVRMAVDDTSISLPHAGIRSAKLVLTDELIAATKAEERV